MGLKLTPQEVNAYLDEVFPQIDGLFSIESLKENEAQVRMHVREEHLRPGNTVSGPSVFSLADVSAYMIIIAMIGRVALAVTTSCSIDFMRKPVAGADLIAEAVILKLGRALAVTDVRIRSEGSDKIVARATLTYSIPPASQSAEV